MGPRESRGGRGRKADGGGGDSKDRRKERREESGERVAGDGDRLLGRDTGEALETLRVLVLGVLEQLGRLSRLMDARGRGKRVRALRGSRREGALAKAGLTDWKVCLQTVHWIVWAALLA